MNIFYIHCIIFPCQIPWFLSNVGSQYKELTTILYGFVKSVGTPVKKYGASYSTLLDIEDVIQYL